VTTQLQIAVVVVIVVVVAVVAIIIILQIFSKPLVNFPKFRYSEITGNLFSLKIADYG
jgi:hypothetical protein